jgi:hypothetical protein
LLLTSPQAGQSPDDDGNVFLLFDNGVSGTLLASQ